MGDNSTLHDDVAPMYDEPSAEHDLLGQFFMASAGISVRPQPRPTAPRPRRRWFTHRGRDTEKAA